MLPCYLHGSLPRRTAFRCLSCSDHVPQKPPYVIRSSHGRDLRLSSVVQRRGKSRWRHLGVQYDCRNRGLRQLLGEVLAMHRARSGRPEEGAHAGPGPNASRVEVPCEEPGDAAGPWAVLPFGPGHGAVKPDAVRVYLVGSADSARTHVCEHNPRGPSSTSTRIGTQPRYARPFSAFDCLFTQPLDGHRNLAGKQVKSPEINLSCTEPVVAEEPARGGVQERQMTGAE
jgi:hypothetical protein